MKKPSEYSLILWGTLEQKLYLNKYSGNSLAVQWVGLHASTAGGTGSMILGWVRSLQTAWHSQKKNFFFLPSKRQTINKGCVCVCMQCYREHETGMRLGKRKTFQKVYMEIPVLNRVVQKLRTEVI